MSFMRSPNSGHTGLNLPGHQAIRLSASELAPLDGIMVDRSQLPPSPLTDWGFEAVATRDPKVQIPELRLVADLSARHDVDFLDQKGTRVGGFVFEDAHPDLWWNTVHTNQRMLIYVGDVSALLRSRTMEDSVRVVTAAHIGWAPLAIRAYPGGVGTAAPGQ